jgi:hypothetical protein
MKTTKMDVESDMPPVPEAPPRKRLRLKWPPSADEEHFSLACDFFEPAFQNSRKPTGERSLPLRSADCPERVR